MFNPAAYTCTWDIDTPSVPEPGRTHRLTTSSPRWPRAARKSRRYDRLRTKTLTFARSASPTHHRRRAQPEKQSSLPFLITECDGGLQHITTRSSDGGGDSLSACAPLRTGSRLRPMNATLNNPNRLIMRHARQVCAGRTSLLPSCPSEEAARYRASALTMQQSCSGGNSTVWWISFRGESGYGVDNIGVFEDDGTPRKVHPLLLDLSPAAHPLHIARGFALVGDDLYIANAWRGGQPHCALYRRHGDIFRFKRGAS